MSTVLSSGNDVLDCYGAAWLCFRVHTPEQSIRRRQCFHMLLTVASTLLIAEVRIPLPKGDVPDFNCTAPT